MKYTITILILLILFVNTALAQTYTGTVPNDLSVTTPTEGSTKFREINNSIREIKTVDKNLYTILAVGTTTTLTGTSTFIIGSSTTALTLNFPTASTIATSTCTKEYVILNRNTGTVTLNITVEGISGSPTVSQNNNIVIYTDGTTWFEQRVQNAYNAVNFGNIGTSSFARSGANSDITAVTGLTTYLAIGQGGSGTNTAAGAASAFGVGTEDTPTLTGVVTTGSSTITTLALSNGTVSGTLGITGSVSGLEDADIPPDITLTNITQITNRSHNDVTGTGTYSHTSIDSHIDDTTDPHGTTLTQTNATITTGTVTTLYSTTGNITNQVTTTGTITTLYNTDLTTTTGTITTLNNTNLSGASGTFTGNVQAKTASGFPHLTKIIVGGTEGTGSVTFVGGTSITYSIATSAGSSTITTTSIGTASAGGWTYTGTQTVGIADSQVLPHGTVTLDAAYGITGLTDAWIPNTLTLDNLTQITTRNYNDLSGTSTISPTTGTITTLTGTTGTLTGAFRAAEFYGTGTSLTGIGTTTAGADKMPLASGSGKLTWDWLDDTIVSISATTTTTLSGTTTTGRIFNSQSTTEVAGSTTAFDDSGSTNHTMTPVGQAELSTVQKKFGLSSGYFDRTAGAKDYLTAPAHANWNFGTNDFTIEGWHRGTETTLNLAMVGWGTGDNFLNANSNLAQLYLISTGSDSATISNGTTFGTLTTTTWTHVAISREGNTLRGFTEGIQGGTWSVTGKSFDYSGNVITVGIGPGLVNYGYVGYSDEIRISNTARYTGNFATSTTEFVNDANTLLLLHLDRGDTSYFANRLAYVPPGTTNAFLNIISDGTNSTKVEIVLGSETPFSSSTVHVLQGITASRTLFGFYDAYCFAESKDIIESGTSVQDEAYAIAKKVSIVKSHPVIPDLKVKVEEAKTAAQEDYLGLFKKSDIETYKRDRVAEYTTTEAGSVSVNWANLSLDAQAYHEIQRKAEFEVLPDLNERIRIKKKTMESDKGITNISIIADDASTDDLLKGADNRTANLNNQIGVLFGAFQRQTEEIGSLTAALENQKIAYNEEVDNLYKWINAIIIAIIALGAGTSGWATLRNKRKGT